MKVIYFDTETTGLKCNDCQIIELAMLIVEDGKIVKEYDKFVNIGCKLPSDIIQITGITDEMLIKEGVSEKSVAKDLKDNLTPGTWMVAHNCQFDLSFVYNLLERHYPGEAYGILESLKWLDTLTVLKDRKKYPHKLSDAVEFCEFDGDYTYYNLDEISFHRAIDDTKALFEVTHSLRNSRNDLKDYKNLFGFNPKYPIEKDEKFGFIIYRPQHYPNYGFENPDNILPKRG